MSPAKKAAMETEETEAVEETTAEEQSEELVAEEEEEASVEIEEEAPVVIEDEEEPVKVETGEEETEPAVVEVEPEEESVVVTEDEPPKEETMQTEEVAPGTEPEPVAAPPAVEKPLLDPETVEAMEELDGELPDEIDTPKLLVQELDPKTTEDDLKEYFSTFGEVRMVKLKKDDEGDSKGFCFVVFSDPANISKALEKEQHEIGEKVVKLTTAMPSSEKMKTNKLFIGGLPAALSEEHLRNYFEKYGKIHQFQFIINKLTNIRKAFCFITFESPESVEKITEGKVPPNSVVHTIDGHTVDCKKKFDEDHPVQKKIKARSAQYNSNRNNNHQGYNSGYSQGQYDAAAAAYGSTYGAAGAYGAGAYGAAPGYDQYYAQYGYQYGYPGYSYPGYGYPAGYQYPPGYGSAYGPVKQQNNRSNSTYKPY